MCVQSNGFFFIIFSAMLEILMILKNVHGLFTTTLRETFIQMW